MDHLELQIIRCKEYQVKLFLREKTGQRRVRYGQMRSHVDRTGRA